MTACPQSLSFLSYLGGTEERFHCQSSLGTQRGDGGLTAPRSGYSPK